MNTSLPGLPPSSWSSSADQGRPAGCLRSVPPGLVLRHLVCSGRSRHVKCPGCGLPAGDRLAHLSEDVRIGLADLRWPRPAQYDHRLLIVVTPGRSEEAADEVAQASEVLIVRHAEAVIDRQHRIGPGSPFADEDHPEAAADRRTRRERHGPEITQQSWPQGGLISLAERKLVAGVRYVAESVHDSQCRTGCRQNGQGRPPGHPGSAADSSKPALAVAAATVNQMSDPAESRHRRPPMGEVATKTAFVNPFSQLNSCICECELTPPCKR